MTVPEGARTGTMTMEETPFVDVFTVPCAKDAAEDAPDAMTEDTAPTMADADGDVPEAETDAGFDSRRRVDERKVLSYPLARRASDLAHARRPTGDARAPVEG